jgi:hypothetical protein
MKGRRGRRRKQLLDDLKEKIGNWKLEHEALEEAMDRSCDRIQNNEWDNINNCRVHYSVNVGSRVLWAMTSCNLLHLHQELKEPGGCFFYPKNGGSRFVPDQPD